MVTPEVEIEREPSGVLRVRVAFPPSLTALPVLEAERMIEQALVEAQYRVGRFVREPRRQLSRVG